MDTVIHEAGRFDAGTGWQFCTTCGEAIKAPLLRTRDRYGFNDQGHEVVVGTDTYEEPEVRGWPIGALVEVSRFGQCMVLELKATPTCVATAKATEAA